MTITKFIYSGLYYVTMNKQKWKVCPEIQTIIEKTSDEFHKISCRDFDVMNKQAYEYSLENGVEFFYIVR